MEEKKLTDDEIVNAYIHCVLKRGDCDNCPYDEVGCGVDGNDLIKIINRQKAEIERLTEENSIIKSNPPVIVGRSLGKTIRAKLLDYDRMKERNAELQKQVDVLTRKVESYQHSFEYNQGYVDGKQQAVKDTAKEIYGLAVVYYDGNSIDSMFFNELEERYGVEVER